MHGLHAGFYEGFGIGMGVWALVMLVGEERIAAWAGRMAAAVVELSRKLIERR